MFSKLTTKKLLAVIITTALAFGLTACNNEDNSTVSRPIFNEAEPAIPVPKRDAVNVTADDVGTVTKDATASTDTYVQEYYDKLAEYIVRLSLGDRSNQIESTGATPKEQIIVYAPGVYMAELIDFDGDGKDELFICYVETDSTAVFEVWAFIGGEMKQALKIEHGYPEETVNNYFLLSDGGKTYIKHVYGHMEYSSSLSGYALSELKDGAFPIIEYAKIYKEYLFGEETAQVILMKDGELDGGTEEDYYEYMQNIQTGTEKEFAKLHGLQVQTFMLDNLPEPHKFLDTLVERGAVPKELSLNNPTAQTDDITGYWRHFIEEENVFIDFKFNSDGTCTREVGVVDSSATTAITPWRIT